jgi:hypothetical protein
MHALAPTLRITLLAVLICVLGALPSSARAAASAPPDPVQIDAYLTAKGSPMAGSGTAFVASGQRWQVDPRLLVAIAGAESSFGRITCAPFNAWGWGCPDGPYDFTSWADGIETVTRGLRVGYLAEGRTTVASINQKYAPLGAANDPTGLNNYWTINVSRFLIELGGNPNDLDMDGIAGTLALGPIGGLALASEWAFAPAGDATSVTPPALRVVAGEAQVLSLEVRNTGTSAWGPQDVRLRRVDVDPRIVGATWGDLAKQQQVAAGTDARFVVRLAGAGTAPGRVLTRWRLESPSGPFGDVIDVPVVLVATPHAVRDLRAEVQAVAADGTQVIIVRGRNAGSQPWRRDAELRLGTGSRTAVASVGWITDTIAARLLEREVAPGEEGSFALRVRGSGPLALELFVGEVAARSGDIEIPVGAPAPPP